MSRTRTRLLCAAAVAALAVCSGPVSAAPDAANPFAAPSTLPFEAPPLDRIKDSDFQPGLEQGMAQQLAEIEKIADNPAPATFDNTIVAMEKSGRMLERAQRVFAALTQANTDDALQKVEETEAPKLAAHNDAIYLNPKLFARVQAIYDKRDTLHLDPEALQLVKVYYQQFVHAGAKLSDADKTKLRAINEQLSTLETAFDHKLLAATKAAALVVDDKAKLAGLGDSAVAAAAGAAEGRGLKGKWVIPLQNTTQQPSLQSLTDRAVREQLFENSWTRTEKGDANDTRDTIADSRAASRPEGRADRLSELRRLCAGRPDGEHARQGRDLHGPARGADGRQGARRSEGHSGRHRQGRPAFRSQALGLGALLGTGAQGEIRSGRERDQTLFRNRQRAQERRVLRRQPALRRDVQGAQGHPRLSAGRARVRSDRQGRLAARPDVFRLLQARQQVGRRVDG